MCYHINLKFGLEAFYKVELTTNRFEVTYMYLTNKKLYDTSMYYFLTIKIDKYILYIYLKY